MPSSISTSFTEPPPDHTGPRRHQVKGSESDFKTYRGRRTPLAGGLACAEWAPFTGTADGVHFRGPHGWSIHAVMFEVGGGSTRLGWFTWTSWRFEPQAPLNRIESERDSTMATAVQTVLVPSPDQIEMTIAGYISQGFSVQSRTPESVTLFKKKEFSILWLVVGFLLCIIPLLVYLIIYANEKDQMVIIRVAQEGELTSPGMTASLPAPEDLTWSTDRKMWWDGNAWQDAATTVPHTASYSDDNHFWWDGAEWRPNPVAPPAQGA